jgi:hypothetical protein
MAHLVNASYNILGVGGVPTASVGNLRSPRRQVGRCGDGCVADQEPPDRCGDDFKIDVSYSKGDTKAVISTSGGSPSFAMFGRPAERVRIRALALDRPLKAVYLPGSSTVVPAT